MISTQNRRFNTPITTLPPLSHSRTYYTTSLQLPTNNLLALDLWKDPSGIAALPIADWWEKLVAKPHKTRETDPPPPNNEGEWVDNNTIWCWNCRLVAIRTRCTRGVRVVFFPEQECDPVSMHV